MATTKVFNTADYLATAKEGYGVCVATVDGPNPIASGGFDPDFAGNLSITEANIVFVGIKSDGGYYAEWNDSTGKIQVYDGDGTEKTSGNLSGVDFTCLIVYTA